MRLFERSKVLEEIKTHSAGPPGLVQTCYDFFIEGESEIFQEERQIVRSHEKLRIDTKRRVYIEKIA